MAISAQSVIKRVVDTLQDTTSIRWNIGELIRYLNDSQREILLHRPDASNTLGTLALTAGATRHTIPANAAKLLNVIRNTGGNKRAIRKCDREILDAQVPGWHGLTNTSSEIVHFMFDPLEPKVFYSYPPAGAASSVEYMYSALPTDLTEPPSGDYTAVSGSISMADIYANAMHDYICYRAYRKDVEYAGNKALADAAYAMFATALGIEIKATVGAGPNSKSNPNVSTTTA